MENNHSTHPNPHRPDIKKASIVSALASSRSKRRTETIELRSQRRDHLISAKRFRHPTSTSHTNEESEDDFDEDDVDQVIKLLRQTDKKKRIQALKTLSKNLIQPSHVLIDFVNQGECMALLTKCIQSTDPEDQIHATWCISNIAASFQNCRQVIPLIPYLVHFMSSQNMELADHAAWAIGNIAVEGPEYRDVVIANGALVPLLRFLDSKDVNLLQTACFSLSCLVRGQQPNLESFFASGVMEKLKFLLSNSNPPELTAEVGWILTYATSGPEIFCTRLIDDGFAPLLVNQLELLKDTPHCAIPLIRTVGNMSSGTDSVIAPFMSDHRFLELLKYYINSDSRPLKKESLWLLSNITGGENNYVQIVMENDFAPLLISILMTANYDIRKEAAYPVMNIICRGKPFFDLFPYQSLLPAMISFIRSQDTESIKIGVDYVNLLLTMYPNEAAHAFEEHNAYDSLENVLIHPELPKEIAVTAKTVLDSGYHILEAEDEYD